MFNESYLNRNPEDDRHSESEQEQENERLSRQGSFDRLVHKVLSTLGKAAFESDDYSTFQINLDFGTGIWDQVKQFLRKPLVKEGIIITSVIFFKTGLWFAYRKAAREGLEILDL